MKNVLKEIIIILLLTVAIIVILGVVLYEYVPSNKVIPEKVSYTTPESIKTAIEESSEDIDDTLEVTYHVDATDLTNYKRIQEYVPGRNNPFASTSSEESTTETTTSGTTTSSTSSAETTTQSETTSTNTTSSSSETSSTTNTSSGYLPNKGTK